MKKHHWIGIAIVLCVFCFSAGVLIGDYVEFHETTDNILYNVEYCEGRGQVFRLYEYSGEVGEECFGELPEEPYAVGGEDDDD